MKNTLIKLFVIAVSTLILRSEAALINQAVVVSGINPPTSVNGLISIINLDISTYPVKTITINPLYIPVSLTPDGSKIAVVGGVPTANMIDFQFIDLTHNSNPTQHGTLNIEPTSAALFTPEGDIGVIGTSAGIATFSTSTLELESEPAATFFTTTPVISPDAKVLITSNNIMPGPYKYTSFDSPYITIGPVINFGNSQTSRPSPTPDGKLVVVTSTADTATIIRSSDNTVLKTVKVGKNPGRASITPDGKKALVTNQADRSLTVIDLTQSTFPVIATVENLGKTPSQATISLDSLTAVTSNLSDDGFVSVIDLQTYTRTIVPVSTLDPTTLKMSLPTIVPDGSLALVTLLIDQAKPQLKLIDLKDKNFKVQSRVIAGTTQPTVSIDETKAVIAGPTMTTIVDLTTSSYPTVEVNAPGQFQALVSSVPDLTNPADVLLIESNKTSVHIQRRGGPF